MEHYEEKLLIRLVEKYRSSKKDSGTNRIHRRTQVQPSELYRKYERNDGDLEQIGAVNQAAERCRAMGFLAYEMKGFSSEIEKIYLVDERVEEIEAYLAENCQYQSKGTKRKYVEELIARYSGTPAAAQVCGELRRALESGRIPQNYLQTEDVLKALAFLERNREPLYLREASMLIFGSSKALEERALEGVCRALRAYYGRPCEEDELPDEILEVCSILPERQRISLKGEATLFLNERAVDIGGLADGITFSTDELAHLERVEIRAARFMTVENKTSYLRSWGYETVYFFLGGYATRFQRDFLKLVYRDNPFLCYLHFGDIDAGGFYIHEHLCRITGIPFQMERMSAAQLEDVRFRDCLQELTDNDRRRLSSLVQQPPYQEIASYMLAHNVKLEQEIVSYHSKGNGQLHQKPGEKTPAKKSLTYIPFERMLYLFLYKLVWNPLKSRALKGIA